MRKMLILPAILLFAGTHVVFSQKKTVTVEVTDSDDVVTALGVTRQSKSLPYATRNVLSDTFVEARSLNIATGLSGKVAGLSMTPTGSGVGAEAKILLRGNRSISGNNQPLYVVDGIILNGDITNISPDNIESISVLKGAGSAALYGNRAGNGAIIIVTKSGKGAKEGISVNLGFTYNGSSGILLEKSQNRYGQGASGIYSSAATVSWGPKMDESQVPHWSNDPNYEMYGKTYAYSPQPDNIKDYFRMGNSFAANLQVNFKTKKSNTAFSYSNTNASGIVATNNLTGHNLDIRFGSKLFEKLTLDSKINFIKQNFENVFSTGESYNNPMRYLFILPRNIRTTDVQHYTFKNTEGQDRQHYWKVNDNGSGNPYWSIYNIERPEKDERVIGMLSLKYQITKELSIQGRSAFDKSYSATEMKQHNNTYTNAYYGAYSKASTDSYEWNSDILVNFHKSFSDFNFDLNAGANNRVFDYNYLYNGGSVLKIENLFTLSNCESSWKTTENFLKERILSVYGFGSISYKNSIFLDITGRNDWGGLFKDNRSNYYPSVGFAAVLSDLITLPEILTYVRLRGSYAKVGNLYHTLSTYRLTSNLKPEKTKSIEAGFDIRMIEDRIILSATYYKTNTTDQLFATPVSYNSGFSGVYTNGVDVQNNGLELTLGAAVISTKDFEWDIDINWSKNNSEVKDIAEGFTSLSFGSDFIREYKLVKDHPFGDVYAKGWSRDSNGNVIIASNGVPETTPGMTVKVANYNPDWLCGFSNTFRYKGFTFSALIDIRQGGSFVSLTEAITAGAGIIDYTEQAREGGLLFGKNIFESETGVTSEGTDNPTTCNAETFWSKVGGNSNATGEAFVRDASNIRMREIILAYNLPKNMVDKIFFSSARVSLFGRNLFFISNKAKYVDPEVMMSTANYAEGESAFVLPSARTYGISLNFGF
ncbi:MAG: SusC/RagA family TonB-linked outer membrane protein [Bacteroidales bacterium]|nr:SusC/RagA family TonB-linked outer membrane protein [Bacteroidales bacterium]